MFVDLPLEQLCDYRPEVAEPADFDEFWAKQMAAARAVADEPSYAPADPGIVPSEVFDVRFTGFGGTRVAGWLQLPHQVRPGAPLIVQFIGYNGGRGDPLDWLTWPALGFPHFAMDSRGQGGGWLTADTPDPDDTGAPSTNGFMTRGVADPETYYFTRLFVDAARALETLRGHPAAENGVVVTGGSQGGALALAAAHLADGARAVLPDVPFLAHPRRAVEVTDAPPFGELIEYCALHNDRVAQVFSTLSYIDVVNHGKRVGAPALFSVGLLDPITPASTIFAAYNSYAGPKDIRVYPFNGHEGGGVQQVRAQLDFLAGLTSETGRSQQ